ncbi:hypothetical protein ACRS8M_14870, partial [Staphylococcus aureus]
MVVEKRNPIPVKEAIQRIVNQQSSMPAITVALEKSLNHILAEDKVLRGGSLGSKLTL